MNQNISWFILEGGWRISNNLNIYIYIIYLFIYLSKIFIDLFKYFLKSYANSLQGDYEMLWW